MTEWPTEGFYWARFTGSERWVPVEFADWGVRMFGYVDGGHPDDYLEELGPRIEPPMSERERG